MIAMYLNSFTLELDLSINHPGFFLRIGSFEATYGSLGLVYGKAE
jgi:hypothetical protein